MRKAWLLSVVLAACKFTEFDDLANEAGAHSTTKPDIKSSDYGVAMASARHSGDGANVLVMGTDPPTFSTLEHDRTGGTSLGKNAFNINVQKGIASIPDPPILLSDPITDKVALVIPTGDQRTYVLGGDANAPQDLALINDPGPQAATLLTTGEAATIEIVGKGTIVDMVVNQNFHTITPSTNTTNTCTAFLANAMTAVTAVAMVSAPAVGANGTTFVWTTDGTLVGIDNAAAAACGTPDPNNGGAPTNIVALALPAAWASDTVDLAFKPVQAEAVLVGDHFAIFAGHTDPAKDDKGQVIVVDLMTGTVVTGGGLTADGLRGFAFGELADGNLYLALGFPTRSLEGVATAGEVNVHRVDPASATVIDPTIAMRLADAQPEANEKFGRSLAITSFNDKGILVVGAANEIFSYYETSKYDDTRK